MALLAAYRRYENWICDAMDRWVMRMHDPVTGEDGNPWCRNHWRPRLQAWPCDEYAAAADRFSGRRTPLQPSR